MKNVTLLVEKCLSNTLYQGWSVLGGKEERNRGFFPVIKCFFSDQFLHPFFGGRGTKGVWI